MSTGENIGLITKLIVTVGKTNLSILSHLHFKKKVKYKAYIRLLLKKTTTTTTSFASLSLCFYSARTTVDRTFLGAPINSQPRR